jgi:aspartate/methionine/tyrosine aminotransferase
LARLIGPRTKAILVSTPHNPTGWLADASTWERIVDIAQEHGLWLFSDEVYRGLERDPETRLPQACDLYERGVSLNGLSKSCGLAGLRIGWIATRDRGLFAKLAAYKDYLSICNSAPSEYLAGIAIRNLPELFGRCRKRLARNLGLLESFFARQSGRFRWTPPRGGSTSFAEYSGGDSFELCERLVRETGIMLVPGRMFGMEGGWIRFGYGRENLPEVLPLLEDWLERLDAL